MSGNTNFPTALDDDTSLGNKTDGVSTLVAADHNNLKEAMKAIEAKIGIYNTSSPTALDFRLGNPTTSHSHNGASGQGQKINPTTINSPSGAVLAGSLYDHLMSAAVHGGFVPAILYVECNASQLINNGPIIFDKFYDVDQNLLPSLIAPSQLGITYASGLFTALEDGVWNVKAGLNLLTSGTYGGSIKISTPNWGIDPGIDRFATSINATGAYLQKMVVMQAGENFKLFQFVNGPTVSRFISNYAEMEIVRLSNRIS